MLLCTQGNTALISNQRYNQMIQRRILIKREGKTEVVVSKRGENGKPLCRLVSIAEADQLDQKVEDVYRKYVDDPTDEAKSPWDSNCEMASISMGHDYFATATQFALNNIEPDGHANLVVESAWCRVHE